MDGIWSRMTTLRARALSGALLATCSLAFTAGPALAADPAADFAPGTSPVAAAQEIAKTHWQANPCGGQVTLVWMALSASVNATSTWANPAGQYDAPEQNTSCQIAFNTALTWDWTRFCSILVHEYGHLSGHAHSPDAADIMYAFYEHPVDECVAAAPGQPATAPEIAAPAPAPAVPAAAPTADSSTAAQIKARAAKATPAAHHTAKRGWIVLVRHPQFHTTNHAKHRHTHHHLTAKQRHHAHWLQLMAQYHRRHSHA
jgi:hypothetical protein